MVDAGVLPGFLAVLVLFLAPPGPDMAYMIAVGLESGRRSAVRAILGIGTGMSIYATAVVIGLGGAAQAHSSVLDVVKALGALYLVWLAYVTIRHARRVSDSRPRTSTGRPYLRGLVVTLANPKVLLFFLAVLPQFTGNAQNAALQLAMLGAVNVASEVLLYGTIGVLAGTFHSRFSASPNAGDVLSYVAAGVYLVLAVVIGVELFDGSIRG